MTKTSDKLRMIIKESKELREWVEKTRDNNKEVAGKLLDKAESIETSIDLALDHIKTK